MVCRRTGEWLERTDVLLRLSVAGCAGMLGGATNGIVEILLYYFGVNTLLNCTLYPIPYHPGWLYNKMVWGALWAVLHVLPFKRPHWLLRSVLYGLIASTIHCGIVFPAQGGGMYASKYGRLTPIIVYITDAAWALSSGAWYYNIIAQYERRQRHAGVSGGYSRLSPGHGKGGARRKSGSSDNSYSTALVNGTPNDAESARGIAIVEGSRGSHSR